MKRIIGILTCALALLFVLAGAAHAKEVSSVKLEHKFKPGESVGYVLTVDSDSMFTLYGLEKKIIQKVVTTFNMTENSQPGSKNVLAFILDILEERITSEGESVDSPARGSKINLKLSREGKVMDSSDPAKLQYFQDMIVSFPEKAVGKGEEWNSETPFKIKNNDGTESEFKAVLSCKIEDFKLYAEKQCAVIATKLVISDSGNKSSLLKAGAEGRMYFDYENGKIIASDNLINMNMKVMDENSKTRKTVEASTLRSKITVKLTLK